MDRRFTGKTAILTGSSRGIGFGIAERLVAEGARVVMTARHQDALDEAVTRLGGPEHALGVAGKADDAEHQAATVAKAIETFGSVDVLVNNAGISLAMLPLMETDLGAARKTVAVNGLAPLQWTIAVHDAWMRDHGGAILNISSLAAVQVAPGLGFYGISKAMLAHLTAQLAVELGPGIRVNAVAPAIVKTQFASPLYLGREDEAAAPYPLQRLGAPSDIGSAAAFLLSDEAGWITGQQLLVDGGISLVVPMPANQGTPELTASPH